MFLEHLGGKRRWVYEPDLKMNQFHTDRDLSIHERLLVLLLFQRGSVNASKKRKINTIRPDHWQYNLRRHSEHTHVICLLALILIYFIVAVFITVTFFFMKHNLYIWNANKRFFFFKFYVVHFLFRKKSSRQLCLICKRFLFPENKDPPKVATPKGY